jgi:hypothetical protein
MLQTLGSKTKGMLTEMANSTFTVTLTPEQLTDLTAQALKVGVVLKDTGTLPKHEGVQLGYAVAAQPDGTTLVTFTILSKPMIVSAAFVESKTRSTLGLPAA